MEQELDCRLVIRNLYPTLHNVEKKIADYILENPEKIVEMTIAQLALSIGVAESSIVRFCRLLDLKGFTQLKINLARNIMPDTNLIYRDVCKTDSPEEVVHKVFASSIRVLEDTGRFLDMEEFNKAVELLKNADRIEFYGVYTSSVIARDAYNRLHRIGYPAYAATDPYEAKISASMLGKGDVAVGISHTGRTRDTIEILELAKESGASAIAITSSPKSPVTEVADISLVICADEQQIFREAITSRIAHIVLLDAVCVCLGLLTYEETSRRIEINSNIINKMRY